MKRLDIKSVVWPLALLLLVSMLHYLTPVHHSALHDLYKRLYYVPILLVAIRYGWRGGLWAGVAASFFYLPHILIQWGGHMGRQVDQIMEIPVLLGAGALVGLLTERDRKTRSELSRLQQAAALGRATASIIAAMKTPMATISGLALALGRQGNGSGWTRGAGELIAAESAKLEGIRERMISLLRCSQTKRVPFRPAGATHDVILAASHLLREGGVRICLDFSPTTHLYMPIDAVREALSSALATLMTGAGDGRRISVMLQQRRYGVEWLFVHAGADPSVWRDCDTISKPPALELLVAERVALSLGGTLKIGYENGEVCAVLFGLPSRVRIPNMGAGRVINVAAAGLWERLKWRWASGGPGRAAARSGGPARRLSQLGAA